MITASASIVKVPPGYYPQLSMVLNPILNPSGIPGSGKKSDKVIREPHPLLTTPKAISARAWYAAHKQRKRVGMP